MKDYGVCVVFIYLLQFCNVFSTLHGSNLEGYFLGDGFIIIFGENDHKSSKSKYWKNV
jgi:hypothetical protein